MTVVKRQAIHDSARSPCRHFVECLQLLDPTISAYFDRRFPSSAGAGEQQKRNEFEEALRTSTTVYIGNLAFTTSDFQLYEV